jgi:hypothetical protein
MEKPTLGGTSKRLPFVAATMRRIPWTRWRTRNWQPLPLLLGPFLYLLLAYRVGLIHHDPIVTMGYLALGVRALYSKHC